MHLLRAGVPLTLLYDVFYDAPPDSEDIYRAEPADLSWLVPAA